MCNGLRTSIADLRSRGLGKFKAFGQARRCLLTNRTIQEDEECFVVLVSAGRTVEFRLILTRMEEEISRIRQQIIVIESSNILRNVLRIVLKTGICMGSERDVRSKVFPQKMRASRPISLNPPRRKPQMYVNIRHEEENGLREQRIRPL